MIINYAIIEGFERQLRKLLPEYLKSYLLTTYGTEPYPYTYSEHDLHEQIRKDIIAYESGRLNITPKL